MWRQRGQTIVGENFNDALVEEVQAATTPGTHRCDEGDALRKIAEVKLGDAGQQLFGELLDRVPAGRPKASAAQTPTKRRNASVRRQHRARTAHVLHITPL